MMNAPFRVCHSAGSVLSACCGMSSMSRLQANKDQLWMHTLSRRTFLKQTAAGLLALPFVQQDPGGPTDWDDETELARSVREYLENVLRDLNITLDFRRINADFNQEFHILIKGYDLMPVASCFKAWLPLYYYLNTPRAEWQDGDGTPLYQSVVFSNNVETGTVLVDVARRVATEGNPIEKYNNFLALTVGMANGLYAWDWPGTPTTGFLDLRYAPSGSRGVTFNGEFFQADNLFTAVDLARGYEVYARGEHFAQWDRMREAIAASRALLAIRAPGYQSPIEFVRPEGYIGKDGVLPADDLPVGRVLADAGIITVDGAQYILALMAAGESEITVRQVLEEVMITIQVYERGRPSLSRGD
jgi:hypothetical protein